MARGRKPEPTALKKAKGVRADRINENEPKPDSRIPDCPPYVQGEALAEWNRVAPILDAMGVLSAIDGTALAIYCLAVGRLIRAQTEIDANPIVVLTERGGSRASPYAKMIREESALILRYMAEFGATPVARTRLTVITGAGGDELDAYLRGSRS